MGHKHYVNMGKGISFDFYVSQVICLLQGGHHGLRIQQNLGKLQVLPNQVYLFLLTHRQEDHCHDNLLPIEADPDPFGQDQIEDLKKVFWIELEME